MISQTLLLFAIAGGVPGHAPAALGSCPADAPAYLPHVRQWFATPETMDFRQRFGLAGIASDDVRPLTNAGDAEVCRLMARAVTLDQAGRSRRLWRGFQAGSFYVMVITAEPAGGGFPPTDGGSGLIFLDASMRVVAASS